jgi:outer membrane protein TolC
LFWPIYIILALGSVPVLAQDDLLMLETTLDAQKESQTEKGRWKNRRTKSAELDKDGSGRIIDLRSVLEEGFRKNPLERIRYQQKEQIELSKTDVFQRFWLPNVALELQTSNHRIDRFHESRDSNSQLGAQQAPTGSLGLVIEDYTLFNWGRDYLTYLNDKETLTRSTQQLIEARRRLKFSLISQYFNLIRVKEVLHIYQEQLRQTSFIHRMAKEKLQLGKIKVQEYYQTRAEFLRSQTEYQQALFEMNLESERLANLLGDDFQGSYRSVEQLKYLSVNTTMEEALKLSLEQSPSYRDAKLAYENASRSYERTLKENLPLPKFSFKLGTYRTGFDSGGTSWNYETTPGNKNVELVAAINMRWTILGDGGFFNTRVNQQAYLSKRITEINYFNTRRELEVRIRTLYRNLRFLEQKVAIAEIQYTNAQKTYDSTLDNYIAGKASYPDIKLAVDNLVFSHINAYTVKYDHLLKKLELADLMGLEDLPGENFEALAMR